MVNCINCGTENDDKFKYCNECGRALPSIFLNKLLEPSAILENRYEIINIMKTGGMGAVYKASDKKFDSICAVKELLPPYGTEEEQELAREWFKREARLLNKLEHNNLPKVSDYFVYNNRYYLVMTFIEGEDLETILRKEGRPSLPEDRVVDWVKQILNVLSYLHMQNPPVIYRDIKPSNIMERKDGQIFLVDFGIARTLHQDKKNTKNTSIGTLEYAAREQLQGSPEPRSDIYSLGATMHHLLTGREPLPLSFKFEKPQILNPSISSCLNDIIMKAVSLKPDDRFFSAEEMFEVLSAVTENKSEEPVKTDYLPETLSPPGYCFDCRTENPKASVICEVCGKSLLKSNYRSTDLKRKTDGYEALIKEKTLLPCPSSKWKLQKSGTIRGLRGIYFIDNMRGWAVGEYGTVLLTDNGGLTWREQRNGILKDFSRWLYQVYFFDSMNGWIVGREGTLLHTDNGGYSWKICDLSSMGLKTIVGKEDLSGIYFTDRNNGRIVGMSGLILNTKDGGKTWSEEVSGTRDWLSQVYFTDSKNGWIVGKNGIILKLIDVKGGWARGLYKKFTRTSDERYIWKTQDSKTSEDLYGVYFIDAMKGWAAGVKGTILFTEDGGVTWTKQPFGAAPWLKKIHFIDPLRGWIVGVRGTILFTEDGGKKWRLENIDISEWLSDVYFTDSKNGWIVGGYGIILKYTP